MGILFIILMIGGVIIVHELGHYLVARWMGIHVVEFSIGFGPRIAVFKGKKRHDVLPPTEYSIAILPFGGFVKMLGVDPADPVPEGAEDVAFGKKPVWRRFLVSAAGPIFNLLLPFVLFFAVGLATSKVDSNLVADVQSGSPADLAGIGPKSRIVSIDGDEVDYWWQVKAAIEPRYDEPVAVGWVDAAGVRHDATLTPRREEIAIIPNVLTKSVGRLGVMAEVAIPLVGVTPGSPAAQAGMKHWDRLLAVDGDKVIGIKEALAGIAAHPERPVRLHYIQYEQRVEAPLGLAVGTLREVELPAVSAGGDLHRGLMPTDCLVWKTLPGSPAARLPLMSGDVLKSLDGRACESWAAAGSYLDSVRGKSKVTLVVIRDGVELPPMNIEAVKMPWPHELDKTAEEWIYGIMVQTEYTKTADPVDNDARLAHALFSMERGFTDSITQTLSILGGLFTGKVEFKDAFGGPLSIGHMASKAGEQGWDYFFRLMGAVSISIGLVNLLPIPILDGGQILFLALEGIRRRPVSMRTRMIAIYASLAFLVILMIFVLRNDFARLAG